MDRDSAALNLCGAADRRRILNMMRYDTKQYLKVGQEGMKTIEKAGGCTGGMVHSQARTSYVLGDGQKLLLRDSHVEDWELARCDTNDPSATDSTARATRKIENGCVLHNEAGGSVVGITDSQPGTSFIGVK
eukprot:scaffold16109_cov81-Cylindrotheca_fusiformis.AAC.1